MKGCHTFVGIQLKNVLCLWLLTNNCAMIKSSTIFKSRIKRWLDFIPLVILIIYAIKLVWTLSTTDIAFVWMNVVGLIILPVNIGMFFWNHKAGVLCLGAILIWGFFRELIPGPLALEHQKMGIWFHFEFSRSTCCGWQFIFWFGIDIISVLPRKNTGKIFLTNL